MRSMPITAAVVVLALAFAGVTGCDDQGDPGSPIPTDSGPDDGDVGLDTSLPALTDPQMTPAPNPNAGGDGAPSPSGATTP